MKIIKIFRYFVEFLLIITFFIIFKILGIKISTFISGKIFTFFGPLFRSKKIISRNFIKSFPYTPEIELKKNTNEMWEYYGKVFAEYPFLNNLTAPLLF